MSHIQPLSFVHRFEPGADPTRPPILLLHGTGGDEEDLLPFGRLVAPGSALLSPRGSSAPAPCGFSIWTCRPVAPVLTCR